MQKALVTRIKKTKMRKTDKEKEALMPSANSGKAPDARQDCGQGKLGKAKTEIKGQVFGDSFSIPNSWEGNGFGPLGIHKQS